MKKLVAVLFAITGFIWLADLSTGATYQPANLGWVNISISSATAAQIAASTAPTIGNVKFCTDCIANGGAGTPCFSTGTTASNQFVLSTGTVCR